MLIFILPTGVSSYFRKNAFIFIDLCWQIMQTMSWFLLKYKIMKGLIYLNWSDTNIWIDEFLKFLIIFNSRKLINQISSFNKFVLMIFFFFFAKFDFGFIFACKCKPKTPPSYPLGQISNFHCKHETFDYDILRKDVCNNDTLCI
jgi:hypothetical protein